MEHEPPENGATGCGSFELFTRDGGAYKNAGIFACSSCRRVALDKRHADECCRPRFCPCGAPLNRAWLKCEGCRGRDAEERRDSNWAAAPKVRLEDLSEDDIPSCGLFLYSERLDKFFSEVELLVEEHQEFGVSADHVYLCVDDPGQRPDAADIVETCCSDMFEDAASHVDKDEFDRLQAFLDEWWAKNRPPGVLPGPTGIIVPMEMQQHG